MLCRPSLNESRWISLPAAVLMSAALSVPSGRHGFLPCPRPCGGCLRLCTGNMKGSYGSSTPEHDLSTLCPRSCCAHVSRRHTTLCRDDFLRILHEMCPGLIFERIRRADDDTPQSPKARWPRDANVEALASDLLITNPPGLPPISEPRPFPSCQASITAFKHIFGYTMGERTGLKGLVQHPGFCKCSASS